LTPAGNYTKLVLIPYVSLTTHTSLHTHLSINDTSLRYRVNRVR